MTTTRRTAAILVATAIATGATVVPTGAMVLPPEPDADLIADTAPSPAMSAGRAWCACNGVSYQTLWIR